MEVGKLIHPGLTLVSTCTSISWGPRDETPCEIGKASLMEPALDILSVRSEDPLVKFTILKAWGILRYRNPGFLSQGSNELLQEFVENQLYSAMKEAGRLLRKSMMLKRWNVGG